MIEQAELEQYTWLCAHAEQLAKRHSSDNLRAHRRLIMRQRPDLAHDFTALRVLSLRILLQECGHAEELAEQAAAVFLRARNRVTPYPEVADVLDRLCQHYTVIALTNGNSDVWDTPLREHFHAAFTASGCGAAKPAPAMFQRAMNYAQVEPTQALHVGDDPERDVIAARRLGMHTVWVNRAALPWPEHLAPADVEVRDLRQLYAWLRETRA